MFFSISHSDNLDFSHQWRWHGITVNTDAGWNQTIVGDQFVVYKGYSESGTMLEILPDILQQQCPELLGNFCVIAISTDQLEIKTDKYRSFPIWFEQQKEITNLVPLSNTAWTNNVISATLDLAVTLRNFNVIGTLDLALLTESQVLDQVDEILLARTRNFIEHNILPIRSFLTGGVDSLLVYSYLKRAGAKVESVDYLHIDYDHFWKYNSHHLKKFWAYNQIHHWLEPTILASGAPGDEFMLRSPVTANMYLASRGTSIPELLKTHPDCLHYEYFMLPKHQKIFESTLTTTNPRWLAYEICNVLVNDWQHWHIGNTLTWTLLRDLDVLKLMLRLPVEAAVAQILDSSISKKLIEKNLPGATAWISDQKNTGAIRKNLTHQLKIHSDLSQLHV
jgi:hypothetical protein